MLAVFSEPKLIRGKFGDEHELNVSGSDSKLFQAWVHQTSDADLCAYFRAVSDGIAQRELEDYHLKICNGRYDSRTRSQQQKWSVSILYGGTGTEGPLVVSRCMSCDLQCPLILGVLGHVETSAAAEDSASPAVAVAYNSLQTAPKSAAAAAQSASQQQQQRQSPVSQDSLLQETEHSRVWLDAKARPMFVVTPKRHLEKLSDLSDAELVDLFRTAVKIVQDMGCSSFNSMVLNHGDNRNHVHLHVKVKVHEGEFQRAVQCWSTKHKAQLQLLRDFRDLLPLEQRGTREAFLLRMKGQKQRQQQGQHQQRQQPWKQRRPNREQANDQQWSSRGRSGQQ